jgi:hypothetical protein
VYIAEKNLFWKKNASKQSKLMQPKENLATIFEIKLHSAA